MARVFVRLKLALIINGFRRGWQSGLGIVVAAVYALPAAAFVARTLVRVGRDDAAGFTQAAPTEPVVVLLLLVVALAWVVGPIVTFGMDETLDPARFQLLPLTRRQLAGGLFAASAVGIGPLATIMVLYGAVVGFSRGPIGLVAVLIAAIGHFLLCVAGARAVTTALSGRLGSRRGRDVLTVAAAMSAVAVLAMTQLPGFVGRSDGGLGGVQTLQRIADGTAVVPFTWPARAMVASAAGRHGVAALWLAGSAAVLGGLVLWWLRGVDRAAASTGSRPRRSRAADLFPTGLRWLPHNRVGAHVAKDLRYAWRVPQLRVQHLSAVLILLPFVLAGVARLGQPRVVLLAPIAALLLAPTTSNVFGGDRGAVWLLEVTGPRPADDLLAKSVAMALLGVPLSLVGAVVLAAATGGWSYLPPAVAIAVGVHAVTIGVGLVVSVTAPFPLPESATNVFAANAGAGCAAMVLQSLGLIVQAALAFPAAVVVTVALLRNTGLGAAAVVAAVWGAAVWWVCFRLAARRLSRRGPEVVAALQARA